MQLTKPAARWAAIAAAAVLVLIGAAWVFRGALADFARQRAIRGLKEYFASDLDLKRMEVSVFPRFAMTGEGLTLHFHGRRDLPPLVSIRRFSGDAGWAGLLTGHIRQVRLEGLEIQLPPKSQQAAGEKPRKPRKIAGFVIDEVIADGTTVRTVPRDAAKTPLVWDIRRLTLYGAGPSSPMSFRATLVNAKPPGEIQSTGKFGPWQADDPGETPVAGDYTFGNADLSVFRGISGTLSSKGSYRGALESIDVQGDTDTPNFAVNISGNPVDLKTHFHALVDGTDGDTKLQPVEARFGRSSVTAQGGVDGVKGQPGKTVSLDVAVEDGRLEDLLRLGAKGKPAMSGAIRFQARLVIPPGNHDIAEALTLDGAFKVASAHFSKLDIQQKVNQLSHSSQAKPEESPADTVASDFAGHFRVAGGVLTLRGLSFHVPGAAIALDGTYGLVDQKIDLHGTARLEAKPSETTTGIKSFLLKAVDPLFARKGAGSVIPIHISGTRDQPSFGLDLRSSAKR